MLIFNDLQLSQNRVYLHAVKIEKRVLMRRLSVNAKSLMFTNIPADWEEQKRVVGI